MKLLYAIAVSAAVAVPSIGAVAQERYPSIWTGLYAGAHIGGGWGRWNDGDENFGGKGVTGGLFGGFNYQAGQAVLGAEVDHDFGGARRSIADGALGYKVTTTGLTSVRGRAGFLVTPSVLVYGTLGYGWGRVKAVETDDGDVVNSERYRAKGVAFGGGIEGRIAQNWSLRGEVLRYQMRIKGVDGVDAWTVKTPVTVVRAGLAYNF